jgi:hypothetical protein
MATPLSMAMERRPGGQAMPGKLATTLEPQAPWRSKSDEVLVWSGWTGEIQ